MPGKCVLIATGFGTESELVVRRGVSIARALHAEPVLLHVYDFPPPIPSSFYPEASFAIHHQAVLDLQRLAGACALGSEDAKLLVRSGHASRVIRATAHELGASLIVVGTRRPHGLERVLAGSVAETVARNAECPVLVIPCGHTSHPQSNAVAS